MQFSIITIAALASSAMAAPPVLLPRVDCSSKSCQALVDEGSCILDAGQNVIKLIKCLADAGGVSNVSSDLQPGCRASLKEASPKPRCFLGLPLHRLSS